MEDLGKYKPYPAYKDSGVEWLGEVPEHWEIIKIFNGFRNIGSGTTPPSDNQDWYGGDIFWVTTGELREKVISDTEKKVTRDAINMFSALKVFPVGSLVIAMYGATIGRLGILGVEASTNQACCVLSGGDTLDVRFVFFFFQAFRDQIILLASGGGQPNISQEKLRSLHIASPSLSEQTTIAIFLDRETAKIDTLITKQERLIELLQEKRSALISHTVTKGLNPDAPMKDSGIEWIGEVPEHWEVKRVKNVAKLESGHTPSKTVPEYWENCDIPWVSLNDSKQLAEVDYITETAFQINEKGLANSSARMLPPGAIVFTRDATIGLAAITTRPMAVSQHLIAWCPTERIQGLFLLRVFNAMKVFLDTVTFGATIKTIGMADVKKLVMPLPPVTEQRQITDFIDRETSKIDTLIAKAKRSIELLQEHRASLISAAVTGKIDVRNFDEAYNGAPASLPAEKGR